MTTSAASNLRERTKIWVESPRVSAFIFVVIVINAITLGMKTSPAMMSDYGDLLIIANNVALVIFCIEILIKLFAFGWRFFLNAWNVFDFLVVGIALIPASGDLAVLRVLRVLRILRLISMLPQLRVVVESLLRAIPGIVSIAALLMIVFYVFAVIATASFGQAFPEWFGNLSRSFYTLFQIMTLESWSMGISRPVMDVYPYAWIFFVSFILVSSFTVLNLFIAIIVNSIQNVQDSMAAEKGEAPADVAAQVRAMREEVQALKQMLQAQKSDK
jgi:voltage-gated sodium channel